MPPDESALQMGSTTGPALSATSDQPTGPRAAPAISASAGKGKADVALSQQAPEPKAEAKPEVKEKPPAISEEKNEVKPKGETKDDSKPEEKKDDAKESKPDDADDDAGEESEEDAGLDPAAKQAKKEAAFKREITKQRNKRRDAEAEAAKAKDDLSTALRALERSTGKAATETRDAAENDPKPKRTNFEDPDSYETALIDWTTRTTTRAITAKTEQDRLDKEKTETADRQTKDTEKQVRELQASWKKQRDSALEKYPDYEDVAESDDALISIPMSHAIIQSDNGADVAYYLGKNLKEIERISALTPLRQAIEIGKLSTKLEAQEAAEKIKVSKAPAPVKPLGSRTRAAEKEVHELSMDEYAERRQKQLRGGVAKPS